MARRRSGRKIDFTHWHGASALASSFGAGTVGVLVGVADLTAPETLLRTRGQLVCTIDGASAPGKLVEIGCGLILMPGGTGTTVTSSPITDADAPWFWYERFVVGYDEAVTDVIDFPGLSTFRKEIDSKSMRIQRPDQEIQFVAENVTLIGADAVNIAASFRFLFGT